MANDAPAEKPADRSALEARAQQHCHDAHYLGTDATGAVHCWSIYHQTVIVFDHYGDLEPETVAIPTYERTTDTTIEDLGEWCAYIAATRGAWDELLVSESLGDQAVEAIEA
jgi:hypothetical protein